MFRTGFARCPIDGEPLQALVADPLEGSTFADRYVIEELVGEGGMGRVYRARHQRVSRQFAIKVLFGDHTTDPKMRERFAREAEAASRLHHPNVISVVDFGETTSLLYLVMDFVEGRELDEVIATEAPMAPARVENLLRQLCLGLDHAHAEGLVHRDFKGNNVILAGSGALETPKIVDFGLAVMSEMMEADRITTEGIVFGTPAYMSPEQATGQEIDHLTDLFAMGVVLYEMLAGVGPFEGSPIVIARQNITAPPPPIAARVPGLAVDPRLEAIAHRLMAKRPGDRYQSGAEVVAELERSPAFHSVPAPPPPPEADTERVPARTEERRSILGYVVAAVIALIIVGGSGTMLWRTITEEDSAQAAAVAPDAASFAPDAAAEKAATPVADAASPEPAQEAIDAAPVARAVSADARSPRRSRHRRRDREETAEPVDQATLLQLYNRVNRQIRAYAAEHGEPAAARFWGDYESIAVNAAIRNPALRTQYMRKLRALQRRLRKAPGR